MFSTLCHAELLVIIVMALFMDLRDGKIRNNLIIAAFTAGFLTNLWWLGGKGACDSLIGFFIPIAILMPLYRLKVLGAGDVKLFGAIGTIMGLHFTLEVMIYAFFAGGIIALVLMLTRNCFIKRMRYLMDYIKGCFLSLSLLPCDTDFKFCFSPAIAVGVFIHLILITGRGVQGL